jgi:hypothetical protein
VNAPQRTDTALPPENANFDTALVVWTCIQCKSSSWKIRTNGWIYCAGCGLDSHMVVAPRPPAIVLPEGEGRCECQ